MKRLAITRVEQGRERALPIVEGLRASGDHDITLIAEPTGFARRIADRNPDNRPIDVANPSRDVLFPHRPVQAAPALRRGRTARRLGPDAFFGGDTFEPPSDLR
jgi:hypothetical protein